MAIYMPWQEKKGFFNFLRSHKETGSDWKAYRKKRKRKNKIARASRRGKYLK